jgi:hypothetical protein
MAHLYKREMGGQDRRQQLTKQVLDELDQFAFSIFHRQSNRPQLLLNMQTKLNMPQKVAGRIQ